MAKGAKVKAAGPVTCRATNAVRSIDKTGNVRFYSSAIELVEHPPSAWRVFEARLVIRRDTGETAQICFKAEEYAAFLAMVAAKAWKGGG